jgi:hypothetical protein
MTVEALAELLSNYRFRAEGEHMLQDGIAEALSLEGVSSVREHRMESDQPDFWLPEDRIAIEVKVGGGMASVMRQVDRYCQNSDVTGVLLVTTRMSHRGMPRSLHGKPIRILWVGGIA